MQRKDSWVKTITKFPLTKGTSSSTASPEYSSITVTGFRAFGEELGVLTPLFYKKVSPPRAFLNLSEVKERDSLELFFYFFHRIREFFCRAAVIVDIEHRVKIL